jgi:hypothetical protein
MRWIQHDCERTAGMSEDDADADSAGETERIWMVEREYTDKGLVTLVYASADGERHLQRQLSERMMMRSEVTAGQDVERDRLEPTPESERERYAAEASRMAENHDPDDAV